jgi:hypothetical protein
MTTEPTWDVEMRRLQRRVQFGRMVQYVIIALCALTVAWLLSW